MDEGSVHAERNKTVVVTGEGEYSTANESDDKRRRQSESSVHALQEFGHVPTEVERKNATLRVELMAALQSTMERFKAVQEELQLSLKNEEEALKSNQLYKKMVEGLLADVHSNEDKTSQIVEHNHQRVDALDRMYDAIFAKQRDKINNLQRQLTNKENDLATVNKQLETIELQYRDIVVRSASDPAKIVAESPTITNGINPESALVIPTTTITQSKPLGNNDLPTFTTLIPAADGVGEVRSTSGIAKNLQEIQKLQALIESDENKSNRDRGGVPVGVMDGLRAYLGGLDVEGPARQADEITKELTENPATEPHYKLLTAAPAIAMQPPTPGVEAATVESPEDSFSF